VHAEWGPARLGGILPWKASGAWVFRGTQVPVRARLQDFLKWFPGVTR